MEKCYQHIQSRGQIAGLSLVEIFILLGVPLVLFPIFTLFSLNTIAIVILEIVLYIVTRLANRVSRFDHGLLSWIFSKFVWPQQLSAFPLDEKRYLKSGK